MEREEEGGEREEEEEGGERERKKEGGEKEEEEEGGEKEEEEEGGEREEEEGGEREVFFFFERSRARMGRAKKTKTPYLRSLTRCWR